MDHEDSAVPEYALFRTQARSAYSRDFGASASRHTDDDLDQRSRLSALPVAAAVIAVVVLVLLGLGIKVPVSVVVNPVRFEAGQLVAVPPAGTAPADLVGASAELRQGDRRVPARVHEATGVRVREAPVPAVVLRVDGTVSATGLAEFTVVVTVGEHSLIADLIGSGGVSGS